MGITEKMLDGLTQWLKVGRVREALKGTRDSDFFQISRGLDLNLDRFRSNHSGP